jgi:hypothetical protein
LSQEILSVSKKPNVPTEFDFLVGFIFEEGQDDRHNQNCHGKVKNKTDDIKEKEVTENQRVRSFYRLS